MAGKSRESGLVAGRYASALLDMAAESKAIETIEKDMTDLSSMMAASPDLKAFIQNPLIGRGQHKRILSSLAEKAGFQALTRNFLGVLAHNRRLPILASVMTAFREELRRRRGEVQARVQTAYALSPAQTKTLQDELSKAMGSRVTLDVEVNKDLLGGMVVTVGSRMIDDSVRRKLERLKRSMSAGSNQNQSTPIKEVG